jgi:hypothetical protein
MSTFSDTFYAPRASLFPGVAEKWIVTSWASLNWYSATLNKDGSVMYAVVYGGRVWKSPNGGQSWYDVLATGATNKNWEYIDCDDAGMVVIAGESTRLWLSENEGISFSEERPKGDLNGNWKGVSVSPNGLMLIAIDHDGRAWRKIKTAGVWGAWLDISPTGTDGQWYCCDCNDAGFIIIGEYPGRLWTYSGSWTEQQPAGAADKNWNGVACNQDSTIFFGAINGSRLWRYASASWAEIRPKGDADGSWTSISCDSTGTRIFCADYSYFQYISLDSASSWLTKPGYTLNAMKSPISSDGTAFLTYNGGGYLYYSTSFKSTDVLPIPYGDLSTGVTGAWKCPLINPVTFVYCYAGCEVLSAANGNAISIFKDGNLVAPSSYVFDESVLYDGVKTIATITFTSDQGSSVITALGKGKPTITGGSVLMDNVVDIVYDFMTVENSFTSADFDLSLKAQAYYKFQSMGYKAAGLVNEDRIILDTVSEMMASFLGSSFPTGDGVLALYIEDGVVNGEGSPILTWSESELTEARLRIDDIINQCPISYAYNYAEEKYSEEDNGTDQEDVASQGVYGVLSVSTPFQMKWCRHKISALTVQQTIINLLKFPMYEIEVKDNTYKRVGVDVGDIICYSADILFDSIGSPLYNHYWKVISVKPDLDKGCITFRALQTTGYMTVAGVRDVTKY